MRSDLRAATGIINGCVIGACMWAIILIVRWWLL